eukprot:COSAG03_NODE_12437_length_547_cov_3272.183036_2_plen_20_part_01
MLVAVAHGALAVGGHVGHFR